MAASHRSLRERSELEKTDLGIISIKEIFKIMRLDKFLQGRE